MVIKKCKICNEEFTPHFRVVKRQVFCNNQECKKINAKISLKKWRTTNPQYDKNNYINNIDKIKIYNKNYRYKNSDYFIKWREQNKSYMDNYSKNYHINNVNKINGYHKNYHLTDKGKLVRIKNRAERRHKELEIKHNFLLKDWENKKMMTKGVCLICLKYVGINKLTLDHTPPISKVSKGYIYEINDVNPICQSCNSRKKDSLIKINFEEAINTINNKMGVINYGN